MIGIPSYSTRSRSSSHATSPLRRCGRSRERCSTLRTWVTSSMRRCSVLARSPDFPRSRSGGARCGRPDRARRGLVVVAMEPGSPFAPGEHDRRAPRRRLPRTATVTEDHYMLTLIPLAVACSSLRSPMRWPRRMDQASAWIMGSCTVWTLRAEHAAGPHRQPLHRSRLLLITLAAGMPIEQAARPARPPRRCGRTRPPVALSSGARSGCQTLSPTGVAQRGDSAVFGVLVLGVCHVLPVGRLHCRRRRYHRCL